MGNDNTNVSRLLGCWELHSTEPSEEIFHLGTRVQTQFTDKGWHVYCSAGRSVRGMAWDILLSTFEVDGNELILTPVRQENSPYESTATAEIICRSEQEIERISFSIRPDGSLVILGDVKCTFKRVQNLAFSLSSMQRVT